LKIIKKEKIKAIINSGVGVRNVLKYDIHKEGTSLTQKKSKINEIVEKGLRIEHLKGSTLDAKIDSIVEFFNEIEKDEKVGISIAGYKKLLDDLGTIVKDINQKIQTEFELQSDDVLDSNLLLDYNLKPRDILEVLDENELKSFCEENEISTRGNAILNILNKYKDSRNLELENYVDIASRNYVKLKENGIKIKEAEIGLKFEELTRQILIQLGLNVNSLIQVTFIF
jgi:hypothetical protein